MVPPRNGDVTSRKGVYASQESAAGVRSAVIMMMMSRGDKGEDWGDLAMHRVRGSQGEKSPERVGEALACPRLFSIFFPNIFGVFCSSQVHCDWPCWVVRSAGRKRASQKTAGTSCVLMIQRERERERA